MFICARQRDSARIWRTEKGFVIQKRKEVRVNELYRCSG